MKWTHIWSKRKKYCLAHLQPFTVTSEIDGAKCDVHITFGHHVFTDEKETGDECNINNDPRYFCVERYNASLSLPALVTTMIIKQDYHLTAFHNKSSQECFYHVDFVDYAIFMTIKKPGDQNNKLKVHIVSAYEKSKWGLLPNGPTKKMYFILSEKMKGNQILKRRKQKRHP